VQVCYKSSTSRFPNFLRNIKAHFKGFSEIVSLNGKPDLIHTHVLFGLSLITLILSFVYNLPFIVSEHWHGFVTKKFSQQNILFQKLLHYTAKKSKALTVVSSFLKQGMIDNNFNNEILVVEKVSVSTEKISDKIRLLSVADLVDEIKNISSIIEVFSEICKTNSEIEYHIIGGGQDEHLLRKQASVLGLLDKQIFFHGQRTNHFVLSFLNNCSFVVINSFIETFSVIAAESLLAGKPILCTDCGGVNDFVDNECGKIIATGNRIELKEAMVFMIKNYKAYDSEKLKAKVEMRFKSEVVGQQFYSIYKSILNKN
jgi:glycosyltransferase involved in cell wall biosynthesis